MSQIPHSEPSSVAASVFRYSYNADFSALQTMRDHLRMLPEFLALHEDISHALMIIITELMTNAIRHGSNENSAKSIGLGLTFHQAHITCIIEDNGPGFDRASIPDPTSPEHIHRTHGRGLYIVEHLANQVNYEYLNNIMRILVTVSIDSPIEE